MRKFLLFCLFFLLFLVKTFGVSFTRMCQVDISESIYMYSIVDKNRVKNLERKNIVIYRDTVDNRIKLKTKEGLFIKGDSLLIIEVYSMNSTNTDNISLKVMTLNSDSFLTIKDDTAFFLKRQEDRFISNFSKIIDKREFSFFDNLNDNYYHDSNNVVIVSLLNTKGKKIVKKTWEFDIFDLHRNIEMHNYKKKKRINPDLYNELIEDYIRNEKQYMIP